MNEKDENEKRWIQQLISYAYEMKMEEIGKENWESFVRDYGDMGVWRNAYNSGETPKDALESEMSYWKE